MATLKQLLDEAEMPATASIIIKTVNKLIKEAGIPAGRVIVGNSTRDRVVKIRDIPAAFLLHGST